MAASEATFDPDLENELTCSICTDILFQPLTLLDCLHTFCGACLKEWFAWQATAAAQSRRTTNPYTCPSCRDSVRSTKADFKVKGLAEAYLKTHPGRGKTEVEKEESRSTYKPGDNVLPPVAQPEDGDSEDERLLEHVRDLSLGNVSSDASRRRTGRTGNEGHRRRAQSPPSQRRRGNSRQNAPSDAWIAQRAQRQQGVDEHQVEHQRSLRSLLSGSDLNAHSVHQEILQSMYTDGVLDGIDTDNLTPAQEEELIERIAEAYQRRQRQRERSRNRERRSGNSSTHIAQATSRNSSPDRRNARTETNTAQSSQPQSSRMRPPISRPHLFEQSSTERPQTSPRSSSQTNSRSPRSNSRANTSNPRPTAPAARSATDLSERPTTENTRRERQRALSSNARSSTDPSTLQGDSSRMRQSSDTVRTPVGTRNHSTRPSDAARTRLMSGPANASTSSLPVDISNGTEPSQNMVRSMQSTAAFAPEVVNPPFEAPQLACSRCAKPNIATELHYHCSKCRGGEFNLCQACYRNEQGCDHWFGFGFMAMYRWQRAAPPGGWPTEHEYPHVLSPRRYAPGPAEGIIPDSGRFSHSDQSANLQEGAFCESCANFADSFYWYCQDCLEGAWGYCNSCVLRGKHCTHPLLPLAHQNELRRHMEDPSQLLHCMVPHLQQGSYALLRSASLVDCDICRLPIPPRSPRYHCYKCSDGDYDVCAECYNSLIATGKISQANGLAGWRRCLKGHRMAILEYHDTPYRKGQVRITVREPAGGWRLKDSNDSGAQQSPPPNDVSLGKKFLAVYNRFPSGEDAGDLVFPKNAELRECEDLNEDWSVGVYCGVMGVFPSNHTRRL